MMIEITDAMVEAAAKAMHDGPLGADEYAFDAPENQKSADWCRDMARTALETALAARPAPEAGSVVERLRKGAIEIVNDGTPSQAGPYPEELQEAADLTQSQAAQIASLSAKVAEVERERDELRAAIFDGTDYASDLRNGNFVEMARGAERGRRGAVARASELQREIERRDKDLDEFMWRLGPRWFLEQGWFPASVDERATKPRAALQQEGESDE